MIEKLTKKQEDAIIPYREKWINRILTTEQSDDEIKQNIKNIYTLVGLQEPKQVWIMDSMFGVQVAINWIKNNKKEIKLERANIGANIWTNINANIGANIWTNISDNIRDNINANIGTNIGANIWTNIRTNIRTNISDNIWDNIRDNIWTNISDNIGDNNLEFFGFSSSESTYLHWDIYQQFYFEQGILPEDKYSQKLSAYIEMAIDAWAVYYSTDIAIVSRKPTLKREDGRLSSDQLPAVAFNDGYELYYLDGVHFEKELWEKVISKEMSLSEIMKIEISDQRTVALKYNPQAIIKENAKLIHKDDRNNELYLVENSEINALTEFPKMWFLKMTCPTGRIFIEGVPPEEAEKSQNATEMQALLCGLTLSEYHSMKMES